MPATATGEPPVLSRLKQGLLHALRDRFGHLLHEVGKFGAVGGVSFIVDIVLFNVFRVGLDMEVLAAKTLSTIVAATIAFVGNRFWTWRHRERSGLAREYGLYFFFNAVGLGIGLACVAISHYGLGNVWPGVFRTAVADNIAANVVGVAFGTLFRFWSYRRFVFVGPATQDAPVSVTKSH